MDNCISHIKLEHGICHLHIVNTTSLVPSLFIEVPGQARKLAVMYMRVRGIDFASISTSFRSHFPIPTAWCFIIIIIIIISKLLLIFQTIETAGVKMSYEMDRQ